MFAMCLPSQIGVSDDRADQADHREHQEGDMPARQEPGHVAGRGAARNVHCASRRGSKALPCWRNIATAAANSAGIKVCDAAVVKPKDIADAIAIVRGRLAKGDDPAGERKAEAKRERARFEPALDAYEADLERRHVVKRGEVMSLLRRELARPLGNVELAALTRNDLVETDRGGRGERAPGRGAGVAQGRGRVPRLVRRHRPDHREPAGRLAAAAQDQGAAARPTGPRARGLGAADLWQAADAEGWPFGPYLQMLLLLGQRRTETALMRWPDVDLEAGVWTVPAAVTKSRPRAQGAAAAAGRRDPAEACRGWSQRATCFPGRKGRPMTGWSKRLPPSTRRRPRPAWRHGRRTICAGPCAPGLAGSASIA